MCEIDDKRFVGGIMDLFEYVWKKEQEKKQAQMELFVLLTPEKSFRFPHESWATLYAEEKKNDLPKL
jgi:hypothetical protein